MRADDPVLAWLLEASHPEMRYLASRDLLRPRPSAAALARRQAGVARGPWARRVLAGQRQGQWWADPRDLYLPKYKATMWQLEVLGDLGLDRRDRRIAGAVEFFCERHWDPRGGGFSPSPRGSPWFVSHLCTTGIVARRLVEMGYLADARVQAALRWLVEAQYEDGGWDCFGRKKGTLDAWEAMSAFAVVPPRRRGRAMREAIAAGAEFFLRRRLLHEGPRFERWYWTRYPWHYHYDHLAGLDFIAALGFGKDPRAEEAWRNLERRRGADGRWAVDHTNGDLVVEPKGRPSKMVTFLALRAMQRAGRKP